MGLRETLENDMKDAMRAKNVLVRDTLRMVIADLKNRKIELGRELEDEEVLVAIGKAKKSRLDSAEQYKDANRPELEEKERAEIAVIDGYLPQQLGEDETREIVAGIISELGLSEKKQMGQVMKAVMAKHKGVIDGKLVQRFAGELLA